MPVAEVGCFGLTRRIQTFSFKTFGMPNILYVTAGKLEVHPDVIADFTEMPYPDSSFKLVVFDPPHLLKAGKDSWLAKKYGKLPEDWPRVIKKGIDECFRVLEDYGVLIFKWNEDQITVREVLKAIGRQPLFGHTTGRHGKTMWMCFMKLPINE